MADFQKTSAAPIAPEPRMLYARACLLLGVPCLRQSRALAQESHQSWFGRSLILAAL